jgi:hypothetical protein
MFRQRRVHCRTLTCSVVHKCHNQACSSPANCGQGPWGLGLPAFTAGDTALCVTWQTCMASTGTVRLGSCTVSCPRWGAHPALHFGFQGCQAPPQAQCVPAVGRAKAQRRCIDSCLQCALVQHCTLVSRFATFMIHHRTWRACRRAGCPFGISLAAAFCTVSCCEVGHCDLGGSGPVVVIVMSNCPSPINISALITMVAVVQAATTLLSEQVGRKIMCSSLAENTQVGNVGMAHKSHRRKVLAL